MFGFLEAGSNLDSRAAALSDRSRETTIERVNCGKKNFMPATNCAQSDGTLLINNARIKMEILEIGTGSFDLK